MTNDTVIKVENVSKKYCRELRHTMLYGIQDIARNAVGLTSESENLRNGEFWALSDVSFKIKKGETLGIIGANGSGKTTLLKLLNGIFMPDKGRIEISGKVGALIEVGAGFHPLLTGRENIYVNGAILGMSKKEMDKKFDEIVDFADIGNFIDAPVKHYSSGMYVRLGFAVAISADPDILILDEVLAVGDAAFQKKCFDKMNSFKESGKTIILVSHALDIMKTFPSKTMLLDRGEMIYKGNPGESVLKYMQILFPEKGGAREDKMVFRGALKVSDNGIDAVNSQERYCLEIVPSKDDEAKSFGAGGAWINWIRIFGLEKPNIFHGGEEIEVQISFRWDQVHVEHIRDVEGLPNNLTIGCGFDNNKGVTMFGFHSIDKGCYIDPTKNNEGFVSFKVSLPDMMGGAYFMYPAIALGTQEYHTQLRWYNNLIHLECIPTKKYIYGVVKLNYSVKELIN